MSTNSIGLLWPALSQGLSIAGGIWVGSCHRVPRGNKSSTNSSSSFYPGLNTARPGEASRHLRHAGAPRTAIFRGVPPSYGFPPVGYPHRNRALRLIMTQFLQVMLAPDEVGAVPPLIARARHRRGVDGEMTVMDRGFVATITVHGRCPQGFRLAPGDGAGYHRWRLIIGYHSRSCTQCSWHWSS